MRNMIVHDHNLPIRQFPIFLSAFVFLQFLSVVTSFPHQNQSDFNVWPKTIKTSATAVQYPQIKNGCVEFYHIFILKANKKEKRNKA